VTGSLPRVGVVVLSQGRRPDGLAASLASVLRQERVALDVVVVGNGWGPQGLADGVRGIHLAENLGIPAGRNAGVPHVAGEALFFLDDDETVPSATFLADCLALMRRGGSGTRGCGPGTRATWSPTTPPSHPRAMRSTTA
jgi:GT2 family glycosyltransferase